MSFAEKSSGTNAVALSLALKKEVYTLPQHHYCAFLGANYIYSKPLMLNDNLMSCLVLITCNKIIEKELIAVIQLLEQCIVNELICRKPITQTTTGKVSLSSKQINVLLMLAGGLTDKAVSIELNVCYDTIKYHKKNIFEKLNANCTVQAVVKAIKENLISVDEINI